MSFSGTSGADSWTGATTDDLIFCLAANDTLRGGGGNDSIDGGADNDSLFGDAGNDTLLGGAGNDSLTGGFGADRFRFATALDAATNRDAITDFSLTQGDRIELENAVFTALTNTGSLVAGAFFIGAAATTSAQRILYNSATGLLSYDSDGNGASASIAFLARPIA